MLDPNLIDVIDEMGICDLCNVLKSTKKIKVNGIYLKICGNCQRIRKEILKR